MDTRLLGVIRVLPLALLLAPCAATQASIVYITDLSGAAESPPVSSPGTGNARVEYDSENHLLSIIASFSDLLGTTTAAHIHCCTASAFDGNAGVATTTPSFPGFPIGVTSGSFNETFDLTLASSFNAPFLADHGTEAGAEAALAAGLAAGTAYFNIHTTSAPGGEIRGFLAPVPIPPTVWLLGSGLLGLIAIGRRNAAGSTPQE